MVRAGYEPLMFVARGASSSVVLKARRREDQAWCAIKCVREDKVSGPTGEQLDSEIDALALLRGHPNVVELVEVFRSPIGVFIVTEWLDGGNLRDWVDKIDDERQMVQVASDVLHGLNHIYSQNIVYRNVCLTNLMFEKRPRPGEPLPRLKIIDFAFASSRAPNQRLKEVYPTSAHFMSPERSLGQSYDPDKSEVWSVGVLLYLLATGRYPFDGSCSQQIANLLASDQAEPSFEKKMWDDLSTNYRSLVKIMLRRKESSRHSLCQALNSVESMRRIPSRRISLRSETAPSESGGDIPARFAVLKRRFSGSSSLSNSAGAESPTSVQDPARLNRRSNSSILSRARSSLGPSNSVARVF